MTPDPLVAFPRALRHAAGEVTDGMVLTRIGHARAAALLEHAARRIEELEAENTLLREKLDQQAQP